MRIGGVGRSWSGSDGSPDAYAGWAVTGSGAGESNKERRLRGENPFLLLLSTDLGCSAPVLLGHRSFWFLCSTLATAIVD